MAEPNGQALTLSTRQRNNPPDIRFNEWHRTLGSDLGMVDVDCVECCGTCWEPLALIEVAKWGGKLKPMTVTNRLARRADLPSFLVRPDFEAHQLAPTRLGVQQYVPERRRYGAMTPHQYLEFLEQLRCSHDC